MAAARCYRDNCEIGCDPMTKDFLATTERHTTVMNFSTTNQPNACSYVLKLLKDSLHPGDALVETALDGSMSNDSSAQAFPTPVRTVKPIDNKMKLELFAVAVVSL
jgi:hypothetical protein